MHVDSLSVLYVMFFTLSYILIVHNIDTNALSFIYVILIHASFMHYNSLSDCSERMPVGLGDQSGQGISHYLPFYIGACGLFSKVEPP